jgi:hypothetical protein
MAGLTDHYFPASANAGRWQQFLEQFAKESKTPKFIKSSKMRLSNKNAIALLLDITQNIEEYSDIAVKNIIQHKNFDFITYPPNGGLNNLEKAELQKLDNSEHLKNALRKIIADTTAGVIFNALNLLDGTGSPNLKYYDWTGVSLIDEQPNIETDEFTDTLHDSFFETYWLWKELRSNKNWSLDTLDD